MIDLESAVDALIDVGRYCDRRGWVPATSGNLSVRVDAGTAAITVSGSHKGRLGRDDLMRVDLEGRPLDDRRPSAETLLHVQLYRHDPRIGCVLHTHSVNATVLSRLCADDALVFEQFEIAKAFPGIDTHDAVVRVPVYGNDQDMPRLARRVSGWLETGPDIPAYLIAGHGLYAWGASVQDALRHLEALEFMFQCELEIRRITE